MIASRDLQSGERHVSFCTALTQFGIPPGAERLIRRNGLREVASPSAHIFDPTRFCVRAEGGILFLCIARDGVGGRERQRELLDRLTPTAMQRKRLSL